MTGCVAYALGKSWCVQNGSLINVRPVLWSLEISKEWIGDKFSAWKKNLVSNFSGIYEYLISFHIELDLKRQKRLLNSQIRHLFARKICLMSFKKTNKTSSISPFLINGIHNHTVFAYQFFNYFIFILGNVNRRCIKMHSKKVKPKKIIRKTVFSGNIVAFIVWVMNLFSSLVAEKVKSVNWNAFFRVLFVVCFATLGNYFGIIWISSCLLKLVCQQWKN